MPKYPTNLPMLRRMMQKDYDRLETQRQHARNLGTMTDMDLVTRLVWASRNYSRSQMEDLCNMVPNHREELLALWDRTHTPISLM